MVLGEELTWSPGDHTSGPRTFGWTATPVTEPARANIAIYNGSWNVIFIVKEKLIRVISCRPQPVLLRRTIDHYQLPEWILVSTCPGWSLYLEWPMCEVGSHRLWSTWPCGLSSQVVFKKLLVFYLWHLHECDTSLWVIQLPCLTLDYNSDFEVPPGSRKLYFFVCHMACIWS